MTNDWSRFGLYCTILDHEFGYYNRLLRSMEEQLQSDQVSRLSGQPRRIPSVDAG